MNKIVHIMILVILVGAGSFYGGMMYGGSKGNTVSGTNNGGERSFNREDIQNRMNRTGGGSMPAFRAGAGGTVTQGEIISRDDSSITLKLEEGSKIVFFTTSTVVTQINTSTIGSLNNGIKVMVRGSANEDGSITASSINLQ